MKIIYKDGTVAECPPEEELHVLRHSAAHIMAQAIKRLFPEADFAFGPATQNGFYYDVDLGDRKLTQEDLDAIEKEMKKITKENLPFKAFILNREDSKKLMTERGEKYKLEHMDDLADESEFSFFQQGEYVDMCLGPHLLYTKALKAFKITQQSGAYWKDDKDNKMLTRINGVAFRSTEELDAYMKQLEEADISNMVRDMEKVDGVKYVLGLETFTGPTIPREMIPQKLLDKLESDKLELLLINSEYAVATDEVNAQIDTLNEIMKRYDPSGMLIGEAPCMKDMIEITNHDFQVVNLISIVAIFAIILLVERSLSLPFILIAVIELAIFINLGISHYLHQSLPFIAPICISTIQLGATVDYAILMTTRYKAERAAGKGKREAVSIALAASTPSIIVSGMGLFAATFGVALYSNIDIIRSICMLLARGALISMVCVLLLLPALLMLCDFVVRHTTIGMKSKDANDVVGKEA